IHSAGGIAIFAVIGLATLAFVWRGMYAMSALQTWGFPLLLAFMVWALGSLAANHDVVGPFGWEATGRAGAAAMWSAMSLANGQMIFQGLMATDYGRFASQQIRYRGTATIMVLGVVPMFTVIFIGALLGATLFGDFVAGKAQDPAFLFVHLMEPGGLRFVIRPQIRIN